MNIFRRTWQAIKKAWDDESEAEGWMTVTGNHTSDASLVKLSQETWAYTCATYVSNAIAQSKMILIASNGPGEKAIRVPNKQINNEEAEILKHPLIDLLSKPNERQTRFEFFSETQTYIDTTGDAYWLVVPGALTPQSLQILPSQNVKIIQNNDGSIKAYQYTKTGGNLSIVDIPPELVIHFRTPNIRSSVYGMGCLEAASKSAQLIDAMDDMELALNKNLAIPSLIVKYTNGSLKPEVAKELEARWNAALRGISKSGKVKVADQNFEITPISLSPRDMQFLQGRNWSRESICAAYRVPLSLLTNESSNRAVAEAGLVQFARYGIQPRLVLLQETINRFLLPWYNEPRIKIVFQNPVPEDKEQKLREVTALVNAGVMTIDEARKAYNLEPLPESEGAE